MRFLLPLPLPRRQTPARQGMRGLTLCCPLSHLLVVVANTLQLSMMVAFLCLLLVCLEGIAPISWFVVFAPLWVSDSVTLVTGVHEVYRVCRARPEAFTSRRNALIAQINRLKGSAGVAVFKFLLAMRQSGVWPGLTIVATCSPYFVAAALRLIMHLLKKPVPPPDGSSARPMRPGTPFNPVHPVILMLACRADGLNSVSWTATFWPLWTVFGLLAIASVAASVLAVGILVARDPPDHGQRALFFFATPSCSPSPPLASSSSLPSPSASTAIRTSRTRSSSRPLSPATRSSSPSTSSSPSSSRRCCCAT